jgi:hypothetical protein
VVHADPTRYTRRCAEREGQAPIEEVAAGIKTAVKAGAEYTQMLLVPPIDLVGPLTSSRLDPLFDAVVQTGYKALRQLFLWNVVVRNADVLVLGRYLENPATTVDEVEFMHNELTRFAFERIGESLSFNKVRHATSRRRSRVALRKNLTARELCRWCRRVTCVNEGVQSGRGTGRPGRFPQGALNQTVSVT